MLVGLDAPDDAAVYRVSDDLALVQTVDFFTPIVDDPFEWGRIAAANALSDVYAMGGRPVTALNLVGWPRSLDFAILGRVLDGGSAKCDEAAVSVVGGHSVDDAEPKFGLTVTGFINPKDVISKTGAPAGCDLILTKPLGMGIITTGIKQSVTSEAAAQRAVEVMGTLNAAAATAMVSVGVAAATDVTGFGLMGHLLQMLSSEVSARIDFSSVPLIEEALDLSSRGAWPGGSQRNLEADGSRVVSTALDDDQRRVLFDAQTSGGLLMAVAHDRAADLMDALESGGVSQAAIIGSLVEGDGRIEVLA